MDRKKTVEDFEYVVRRSHGDGWDYVDGLTTEEGFKILQLLKEQEAVVHPEPSCEMTYFTDCCCDLCGVQLIREDNFCRCCGKRIEWESR